MNNNVTEYENATQTYRFFLDHRMKMLNYALAFNAALLVISVQYVKDPISSIFLSVFSIVATALFLGFELRTIQITNIIWERLMEIENDLGYNTFTKIHEVINNSGVPQKKYIRAVYILLILVWVSIAVYRIYGCPS